MSVIRFSLLLALIVGFVFADEHPKTESDLRKALFQNYDKLVRPVRNVNDAVPVIVDLVPLRIKDVDLKDRTVKLDTWLHMSWQDAFLRWDPSEYGGLEQLNLPPTEVWRPDVTLYSAASDTSFFPTVQTNVVISHNGTVLWVPPFNFKAMCPHTEGHGANDTFLCSIQMGSWTYDVWKMTIQERGQDLLQGRAADVFHDLHDKWGMHSLTAFSEPKLYDCCSNRFSLVKFDLHLKKKPGVDN